MRNEDDLRAVLQSLERHAPTLEAVLPAAARRPERPRRASRRRTWLRTGGPLLVAVAVVAAVVTPLAVGKILKHDLPSGTPGSASGNLSAAQVLAAAAQAAAAQPAQAPGKYWRTVEVDMSASASGPSAHPFATMMRNSPNESWAARSAAQQSWTLGEGNYTTIPATPGAAAAWRADGSPPLKARTNGQLQGWSSPGGSIGIFGNDGRALSWFQALPTSTSGLAAVISKEVTTEHIGYSDQMRSFEICMQLLQFDPLTPAVRAAVYRVLATIPGVYATGRYTDPLGRSGDGIAMHMTANIGGQGQAMVLVIAPGTGTFLDQLTIADSLEAGTHEVPASGALPGLTKCPAGSKAMTLNGGTICEPTVGKCSVHSGQATGCGGDVQLHVPTLALPIGGVIDCYAVQSAGWTNASPQLPPPAQRHHNS
jgi:hypothetical protein